jgi:hypothetical protein
MLDLSEEVNDPLLPTGVGSSIQRASSDWLLSLAQIQYVG